jgi:asparagine synthase (glutamine-hydrolysing)
VFPASNRYNDEREESRLVAKLYNTNHHEFEVNPNLIDVLPKIIESFDQPFADSSFVPNYYICELARRHVTVALSGLGGDELAGGYERYLGLRLSSSYNRLPAPMRWVSNTLINFLREPKGDSPTVSRLKRFARASGQTPAQTYLDFITSFSSEDCQRLLLPEVATEAKSCYHDEMFRAYFERVKSQDVLNGALYLDMKTYLSGDLLTLTDRMSMAHSLEVRVPYLDHELVEFAATVPPNLKLRGLTKKYLIKKAVEGIIPDQIINKKKKGFSIPLQTWFRGDLRDYVSDILSEERVRRIGLFDARYVSKIIADHQAMTANNESKIIALLTFVLWHEKYITRV